MRRHVARFMVLWAGVVGTFILFGLTHLPAQEPGKQEAKEVKKEDPKEEPKNEEPKNEEYKPKLADFFSGSDTPPTEEELAKMSAEDKEKLKKKPPTWPDATGGAAGTAITPAGDGKGDDLAKITPEDLYNRIAHNFFSINMVWVLICGALVMFMQFGFAMVETGLCRAKNAAHTSAMNFMIYPLGCIAFYVYGFGIGWGNWYNAPVPDAWVSPVGPGTSKLVHGWGIGGPVKDADGKDVMEDGKVKIDPNKYQITGTKGFFLNDLDDVSIMALFFFMMVFMDTTATIPTGVLAERWAWKNFCLYGLWVALPYCLYANWVWGGGWLAQAGKNWGLGHGAVDFAGSGVVHLMGGIIGLGGVLVLGPRIGKYDAQGKPRAIPGHHIPMVVFGTFVLAFGWFGFNAGSTLAGTDLRTSVVVVNTMLASVFGAVATMCTLWALGGKADPSMLCNGMLAGLVAITAPCAFVDSWAACLIGAIAGVLVVLSVLFWDRMGIDDPVGAISVHGVNGFFGLVALGLFANGKYGAGWNGVYREQFGGTSDGVRGLFYGDSSQLFAQLLSGGICIVFGFIMAFVWFKIADLITPMRVPPHVEIDGLDDHEMGAEGYPNFTLAREDLTAALADPKPAVAPATGKERFTLIVEGVAPAKVMSVWSDLCQAGSSPPPEFLQLYKCFSTVSGNAFKFHSGSSSELQAAFEKLLKSKLSSSAVKVRVES